MRLVLWTNKTVHFSDGTTILKSIDLDSVPHYSIALPDGKFLVGVTFSNWYLFSKDGDLIWKNLHGATKIYAYKYAEGNIFYLNRSELVVLSLMGQEIKTYKYREPLDDDPNKIFNANFHLF